MPTSFASDRQVVGSDPAELKVTFTLTLEEAAAIYPLREDENDSFLPKMTQRGWDEATERARQTLRAAIKGGGS